MRGLEQAQMNDPDKPKIIVESKSSSPARESLKLVAHGLATVCVIPWLVSFWLGSLILGKDRAIQSSSQALAIIPGVTGILLRRAFLCRVLAQCSRSATFEFGTLFSQTGARIEDNVYVGPYCHLGLVCLERDALIAAGVHIPSGGKTHYFDDPTKPIREQGGERTMVTVGAGAWIGSASVIVADVGRGTIVGAGSVVVKPLPDDVIAAGVPAKVVRPRYAHDSEPPDEGTS